MRFKVLGREIDLIHSGVVVAIEMFLLYTATNIVLPAFTGDAAKAVVIIALAMLIVGAPIFYLYGPPWSSKHPQKPITLMLGPSQPTESPPPVEAAPAETKVEGKASATVSELEARLRIERANAYRWEYAYLNKQLVMRTQAVLDWLYSQKDSPPPSITWFRAYFGGIAPSEQDGMLNVLGQHYLIVYENVTSIQITPKGCEYVEWRGLNFVVKWIAALAAEQQAASQQAPNPSQATNSP